MKFIVGRWVRQRLSQLFRWIVPLLSEELEKYHLKILRERLGVKDKEFFAQWPVTVTGDVHLGDRVSMAAYVHIWGEGRVTIGNGVMIGSHTAIVSNTHDVSAAAMWKTQKLAPILIEDNVWIGAHCVILPGVTVGTGSVVGAGSVVTRDLPPGCVVTGVPAVVRRTRAIENRGSP